jgi:hypothetical protein
MGGYMRLYIFNGWCTDSDFIGTRFETVSDAPEGTLYAKRTEQTEQ